MDIKAEHNRLLITMTRAMREMLMAELYLDSQTFLLDRERIEMLPQGMKNCLLVYHGQETMLQAADEDAYRTLLKEVLRYGTDEIINRFVIMGKNLSEEMLVNCLILLYQQNRWQNVVEIAAAIPADSKRVDEGFWYVVAVAFYHLGNYDVAKEAFERARDMGWNPEEIDSYMVWCREAKENA